MDRLRQPRWSRKAGAQVPKHVQRMMQRLHPTVSILWDHRRQRWAMIQTVSGVSQFITLLHGRDGSYAPPTLDNTVHYLNACHPSRLRSKWDQDRFLRELDENQQASSIARDAQQRIRDGSSDLFNQLTGRKLFRVP